jgi:DNA-binding beta-propeller fold protein YncE
MIVGLLCVAGPTMAATPAGGKTAASPYSFNSPDAAAVAGADLFVANRGGNTLTELKAANGHFVRLIGGAKCGFNKPSAIVLVGTDLFVANAGAGLTEVSTSTGSCVRTIRGTRYGFADPEALATNGSFVFVLSAKGGVTKVATATGAVSAAVSGHSLKLDSPTSVAVSGTQLFVTNSAGNSVSEASAATLRFVRLLAGSAYGFSQPTGVAAHGPGVWVTNYKGGSVTELSAANGRAVGVFPNGYLPAPGPITFGDGDFFTTSPPGGSPMVTEIIPGRSVSMPWWECNTNQPYPDFSNPQALVVGGGGLWVVSEGSAWFHGGSLTELSIATGSELKVIHD